MTECRCMTPPFDFRDYDIESLGIDETNGRFGDVTVETCKRCGAQWLRYFVEYEGMPSSGRWYRGLVSPEMLSGLTPDQAPAVLAGLPWYFYGGSYFETSGQKGCGPLFVDLAAHRAKPDRAAETSQRRDAVGAVWPRRVDLVGEVALDELTLSYILPNGGSRCLAWSDLRAVEIVTTDAGPFGEDVFWVLFGAEPPLIIPQSAHNSDALLARLQEFPGFNSNAIIAAMSSTAPGRFPCWSRA